MAITLQNRSDVLHCFLKLFPPDCVSTASERANRDPNGSNGCDEACSNTFQDSGEMSLFEHRLAKVMVDE